MSVAQAVADVAGVAGAVLVSALEPAGAYAVVRVWSASSRGGEDAPVDYVSDGTYWYVLGCEDGYSWEQVTRHAVRVEVVREGVEACERAEAEALRAHEAGTCHLSEWSCSHCESAAERMGP